MSARASWSRRDMVKLGIFAAGAAPALGGVVGSAAFAQDLGDIAGRDPLQTAVRWRSRCATSSSMDPQGAFHLYEAAVNSPRTMWSDAGHPHHDENSGGPQPLRLPTARDWAARRLVGRA